MKTSDEAATGRAPTPPLSRTFARPENLPTGPRRGPPAGYWARSRGASAAILIVLPLLASYEGGIAALGGDPALRTGVDAWVAAAIPERWRVPDWAPSLAIALGLVAWRVAEPGRFLLRWVPLALLEGLALGLGLLGLYLAFDRWFAADPDRILLAADSRPGLMGPEQAIGLIGAGIFEEVVFRLGLLGLLYAGLRLLHAPNVAATAMAVSGSALAFSMAHHVGEPPGSFTWSIFVFRWLAGAYFCWVYILRGFGIAVGTHVAYDLLVAAYPWPG